MITIKNALIGSLSCAAVAITVSYETEISRKILDSYSQVSGIGNPSAASNTPKTVPAPLKTQVDFLLQQQAQKVIQTAAENELSDSERIQKLNAALRQLDSAEDEYDRELAVMELGELQGAAAKPGLMTALNDDSKLVVSQTIRQINNWRDPQARTELLLAALSIENPETVEQTLLTINVVNDKRLIARLKQLSKHRNVEIRDAAKLALNLAP